MPAGNESSFELDEEYVPLAPLPLDAEYFELIEQDTTLASMPLTGVEANIASGLVAGLFVAAIVAAAASRGIRKLVSSKVQ